MKIYVETLGLLIAWLLNAYINVLFYLGYYIYTVISAVVIALLFRDLIDLHKPIWINFYDFKSFEKLGDFEFDFFTKGVIWLVSLLIVTPMLLATAELFNLINITPF